MKSSHRDNSRTKARRRTSTQITPKRSPAAPQAEREGRPKVADTLEENVQAIKAWEQASLLGRSRAEQFSDWIAGTAAKGPVLLLHLAWFGLWVTANVGGLPGIAPFDPFPFPFLTMTVSLEAIFARHLNVATSVTAKQLRDLAAKTDLHNLTDKVEEFSDDSEAATAAITIPDDQNADNIVERPLAHRRA